MLTVLTIIAQAYVVIAGIVIIATFIDVWLYDKKHRGDVLFAAGFSLVFGWLWVVPLYWSLKALIGRI